VGEKEGWHLDVLKIEGRRKVGRTIVRVKKKHADGKAGESSSNNQLTGVVMHCNRVLG
jgi:hypothetical protein